MASFHNLINNLLSIRLKQLLFFSILIAISPLSQADFIDGITAYKNQNFDKARQIFEELAESDDARAQFALGLMFDNGSGVEQDKAQAFKWYKAGAEGGNSKAQFNLALLYQEGEGTDIDEVKAAYWYGKVARHGNKEAITGLYKLSQAGISEAQFHMSNLYRNGKWLKRICHCLLY